MKIKYKRIDDIDYTEVDNVTNMFFIKAEIYEKSNLSYFIAGNPNNPVNVENVSEVIIEEYENKIQKI